MPPRCVLFQPEKSKSTVFEDLEAKIIPIFPIERSITIKRYSVRRKQVPMYPAFSLTNHKMQDLTLLIAILDLKNDPTAKDQDEHAKFCSLYIQLSQLQSESELYLLRKIDMKDLQLCPHDSLLAEMKRL